MLAVTSSASRASSQKRISGAWLTSIPAPLLHASQIGYDMPYAGHSGTRSCQRAGFQPPVLGGRRGDEGGGSRDRGTSGSDAHRGEPFQILRISDGLCSYSIPFRRFSCGTIAIALKYFRKEPPGLAWRLLERETGFEPATHCLGSNCATTAPLPRDPTSIRNRALKVKPPQNL